MSELGGEKIDIIEWSDDAKTFIIEALAPAKILSVLLREEEKRASVTVAEDQLSLAIGKGGQNARLAAKLTGWKIDIHPADKPASEETKQVELEDLKENTVDELSEVEEADLAIADGTIPEEELETVEDAPKEKKKKTTKKEKTEEVEE